MSDITRDYSFGGFLRHYRIEKKIGLREMSRSLDMDPSNYCNIEQSRAAPPARRMTMMKLIKPLKLNESQIETLAIAAFNHHQAILKNKWFKK